MMNAIKLAVSTLAGLLLCAERALAITPNLPVEDGGLVLVAAAGLVVAIKVARWKRKNR